jgi:hypothetical protein
VPSKPSTSRKATGSKTEAKKTTKKSVTVKTEKASTSRKASALKSVAAKVPHKKNEEPEGVHRSKSGQRMLPIPKRIWYKPLTWRNHAPVPTYTRLPKARKMFWSVLKLLWGHKKLFGYIILTYGLLDMLLVRGLSGGTNLTSVKNELTSVFHGVGGKVAASGISFAYLLANSGGSSSSSTSGFCSLAFIWAYRQVLAKHPIRARDSFYQGMYPLIQFLLIFLLLSVQLLPLAIGGGLYAMVNSGGIAVYAWEHILWLSLFILLGLWSLRMVTASIFALYIVTLPDMTPMRAYRSAKQLVYGRRLLIWRKLIFLPFVLLLLAIAIEFPLILFLTPIAEWAFFVISMLALPLVHGYLYTLYREML